MLLNLVNNASDAILAKSDGNERIVEIKGSSGDGLHPVILSGIMDQVFLMTSGECFYTILYHKGTRFRNRLSLVAADHEASWWNNISILKARNRDGFLT